MSKLQGVFYVMLSSAAFELMPIFAKTASNNGSNTLTILSAFALTSCIMGMNHPEVKKVSNVVSVFYFSLSAGVVFILFTLITGSFSIPLNLLKV